MRKATWRKLYQLPPGYIQESLFEESQQHKKIIPQNVYKFAFILFIIISVCTLYLTQQIHLLAVNKDIAALEKKLATIHKENEKLRLAYTQAENLDYVEQVARFRLGMVRPHKIIYVEETTLADSSLNTLFSFGAN